MKRDSGIGDFGKQGIRTFTRDHQCNSICSGLGFDIQYSLAIGTSRESGELNDDNSDNDHDNDKDEEDEEHVQNQLSQSNLTITAIEEIEYLLP
ncbi:hypothetical protein B0H13DRAFT_1650058 [Mycena leptocephala]|nr:hypothetical protein B0H13DRAFT_1650058 [Mycena leptocephala]